MKETRNNLYTFQLLFFFGILAVLLLLIMNVNRVMIPLGISYILALIIKPIRRIVHRLSISNKILFFTILILSAIAFIFPLKTALTSLSEEIGKLEVYIPKLESYLRLKYESFQTMVLDRFNYDLDLNPVDKLIEFGESTSQSVIVYLPKFVGSLLEWGFIIPLFLYFILKDGRKMNRSVLKIVPNRIVEKVYFLIYRFNTKFGDYIFAKSIEAFIIGIIITLGLVIMGYPFAFLLGVIAAITNILPYIGPVIGFIPALIIGLSGGVDDSLLGAMVLLYSIANIIDLAIVFPLLVSKIVNLHPIMVVLSVIIGSQLLGVVGMIVSIPIAAFIKIFFEQIYSELYGRNTSF